MANPTTNFGWVMPTSTDLVTDLPADFAVFGQAVDTSMADLKGGTTGQILAKATNTDMDFTWITNDQGDITAVNTTAPLEGGGTSGALTLSIASATTSVAGAVQLSDSTSTTSSVLAATPTAVKSAYDLANGAIPKTLIDAAGDLIVGTAADTAGRLAIGTANQVLKVNSGGTALEWGTAGGGGKVLQVVQGTTTSQNSVSSTSYVSTGISASITPSSATSKILVIWSTTWAKADSNTGAGLNFKLKRASTYLTYMEGVGYDFTTSGNRGSAGQNYLDSPATTSATTYTVDMANFSGTSTNYVQVSASTGTITLMEIGA